MPIYFAKDVKVSDNMINYVSYDKITLSDNNPYYEVLRPDTKKKPYMDLDGQLDFNMSKDEFYDTHNKICDILKNEPDLAVRTSSQYKSKKGTNKLSYHIIFKNEVIENTLKCKEYIQSVKMPIISNLLNEVIECKWKDNAKITEKDNVLYCDNSVYSNGRQLLRTVNAYKKGEEERVMKVISGIEKDHIIQHIEGDEKPIDFINTRPTKKVSKKPKKEEVVLLQSVEQKRFTRFLHYLGNPRIDYNEIYLKVGSALAHNGAKYKTFEKWSAAIDIPHRTESDYDAWRSWERQHKKIPFAIAENVLKIEKPKAYAKYMKEIYDIELMLTYDDFKKGTEAIAQKIYPVIKNDIIYHEASKPHKWYVWDKKTGLWDNHVNICMKISFLITKAIEFQEKDLQKQLDNEDKDDKKKDLQEQLKNIIKRYAWKDTHLSSIIKHLQPLLEDKTFHHKLNINLGYIAFKNGLYDIENNTLRDYKYDDFVSITLPYDYEEERNEDNEEFIRDTLMKICNNNKTHLDYYLSVIGYSLLGYADRIQEFYILYGAMGSNGKSKIFEILCNILHHYCKKSNNNMLEGDNKQSHKSIAELKNARLVWVNELPKKKKLNAELIKNIRDGTKLRYEVMYGTEDSLDITFKLFAMTNHEPKFDADGGMDRSFKQMTFNSHFHSNYVEDDYDNLRFKPSNTIDRDLQQRKMDLLHMLFDYSRDYLRNDKLQPFPNEWEEDTKDCIEDNDRFKQFFNERIVKDNGNKLCWKDVCSAYFGTTDGGKKKWVRKEMKRMGCKWEKSMYFGSVKTTDKGGWENYKIQDTSMPCFLFDMGCGDIESGSVVV
jgi:phage/plasmid-associated DNA primase